MAGTGSRPPAGTADSFGDGSGLTPQEAADYIGSLLEGLRLMAHNANLPFLAYLIAVAVEEAKSTKASGKSQGQSQG